MRKNTIQRILWAVFLCSLVAALPVSAQDNNQDEHSQPAHAKQQEHPERPAKKAEPTQRRDTLRPDVESRPNHTTVTRPTHSGQTAEPNRQPQGGEHVQSHRAQGQRPPQWGHRPAHRGSYHFRSDDRAQLLRYYGSRGRVIQGGSRPVLRVGGYFPYAYIVYLSPLPPDLYGYVPPPPPGYEIGYCDGYVVVYDPVTFYIVAVIDLW